MVCWGSSRVSFMRMAMKSKVKHFWYVSKQTHRESIVMSSRKPGVLNSPMNQSTSIFEKFKFVRNISVSAESRKLRLTRRLMVIFLTLVTYVISTRSQSIAYNPINLCFSFAFNIIFSKSGIILFLISGSSSQASLLILVKSKMIILTT